MRLVTIGILSVGMSGMLTAPSLATQMTEIATVPGRYDNVANCLMQHLPPTLKGWPSVSPPPSRDAIVNVYPRGKSSVTPVAVFHVLGRDGGLVTIAVEKPTNVPMARAVANRCK